MVPDKHVQYKEDTNKFIIWLVDIAKKVSYTRKSPRPTPTTTAPRLKGRARKVAQKIASMPKKKETEVRGKEINERHAYFIRILEEALNILIPYVTAPLKENTVPVRPVSSKKGAAQGKSLSNLFDNLDMSPKIIISSAPL
ncbi:MAG: hypothetical protein Q9161_007315 [Pseudevernia consocians]